MSSHHHVKTGLNLTFGSGIITRFYTLFSPPRVEYSLSPLSVTSGFQAGLEQFLTKGDILVTEVRIVCFCALFTVLSD